MLNYFGMAKVCQICQRKTKIKISRSYSNIATKKRQYLNLQWKKINGKRIRICTKCLKLLKRGKLKLPKNFGKK
ncbi:MAG: bL28 family ribosomal protein [Patescibacteria group bacterium]